MAHDGGEHRRRGRRDDRHRRALPVARLDRGRILAWLQDYGVYAASPRCVVVNVVITAAFPVAGEPPHPARPGRPGRHRLARHGAGDRHRGRRPVGRLGDGAGRRADRRSTSGTAPCPPSSWRWSAARRSGSSTGRWSPSSACSRSWPRWRSSSAAAGSRSSRRRAAEGHPQPRPASPGLGHVAGIPCRSLVAAVLTVVVMASWCAARRSAASWSPSAATGRASELAGLPVRRVLLLVYVARPARRRSPACSPPRGCRPATRPRWDC